MPTGGGAWVPQGYWLQAGEYKAIGSSRAKPPGWGPVQLIKASRARSPGLESRAIASRAIGTLPGWSPAIGPPHGLRPGYIASRWESKVQGHFLQAGVQAIASRLSPPGWSPGYCLQAGVQAIASRLASRLLHPGWSTGYCLQACVQAIAFLQAGVIGYGLPGLGFPVSASQALASGYKPPKLGPGLFRASRLEVPLESKDKASPQGWLRPQGYRLQGLEFQGYKPTSAGVPRAYSIPGWAVQAKIGLQAGASSGAISLPRLEVQDIAPQGFGGSRLESRL
eukprot:gene7005-107_t